MIKIVYCVRKRDDISLKAFYKYWFEQHGTLVRRFAKTLRAKKYIQSHTIEPEINKFLMTSRGFAPPYDGIAEIWWDDVESFNVASTSLAAQEAYSALIEDEAKFIDIAQSRVFLTEEHVIFAN